MPEAILAIDAGTTSVRALIFSGDGLVLGEARAPLKLAFPAPGHAEQSAEELWQSTLDVIAAALAHARLSPFDVAAIGIAAQRSSLIVWERASGRPLSPLISWQDMRGAARAQELQREGFLVLPQTAASKVEAVLGGAGITEMALERGDAVIGNVDSYIISRLSGGAAHITDASQACTTGLFDYFAGGWDERLLRRLRIPLRALPEIGPTYGAIAVTAAQAFGSSRPITANIGDQQAALVASGAVASGDAKITLGTSGTLNVHTGTDILMAEGAYPLVAVRAGAGTEMCIEGMVITAGAALAWLTEGLGIAADVADLAALAASAPSARGAVFLPALQGLGTPHGVPEARGLLAGLTRGTGRAEIARAAIEGLAFRLAEVVDHVFDQTPLERPRVIKVDGGASRNEALIQALADAVGLPVARSSVREATALGAGLLAGAGAGLWSRSDAARLSRSDLVLEARWSPEERRDRRASWARAVGLSPRS